MIKAVYLARNSYPHDRHLEDRVIALLAIRLGIETIPKTLGVLSWLAAFTAVISGLAFWGIWRWGHAFERAKQNKEDHPYRYE